MIAEMEAAIKSLRHKVKEKGDTADMWLFKQPIAVICHFEDELGRMPLSLLLYSTEYLRLFCYGGVMDIHPEELLQKSCCFIKQLAACNWNLEFTESGLPLLVDDPSATNQG